MIKLLIIAFTDERCISAHILTNINSIIYILARVLGMIMNSQNIDIIINSMEMGTKAILTNFNNYSILTQRMSFQGQIHPMTPYFYDWKS